MNFSQADLLLSDLDRLALQSKAIVSTLNNDDHHQRISVHELAGSLWAVEDLLETCRDKVEALSNVISELEVTCAKEKAQHNG